MTDDAGLVSPLLVWQPSDASPSGIAVTPQATVYIACLRGEHPQERGTHERQVACDHQCDIALGDSQACEQPGEFVVAIRRGGPGTVNGRGRSRRVSASSCSPSRSSTTA